MKVHIFIARFVIFNNINGFDKGERKKHEDIKLMERNSFLHNIQEGQRRIECECVCMRARAWIKDTKVELPVKMRVTVVYALYRVCLINVATAKLQQQQTWEFTAYLWNRDQAPKIICMQLLHLSFTVFNYFRRSGKPD